MRTYLFILALLTFTSTKAITVISVANGPWTDPGTWDCNCSPGFADNVLVMTDVTLEGNVIFGQPAIHVLASGSLTMVEAGSIAMVGADFTNVGHVQFNGTWTIAGAFTNSGVAELTGDLTNDGTMQIEAGGYVQIWGSFSNLSALGGAGGLCVSLGTENEGAITGTLDICDWTPTTATPPILDQNTGTVEGTVTYCAFGSCATGIAELADAPASVHMNGDALEIVGLPSSGGDMELIDPQGRIVLREHVVSTSARISMQRTRASFYVVVLHSAQGRQAIPVIVTK